MRLIEKYGSGIGRIRNFFREEKMIDPKFENISDGFQVTVFSDNVSESLKSADKSADKSVDKSVDKIIRLIEKNPYITQKELSNETNLSIRSIEKQIHTMKVQGLLERIGSKRKGQWILISKR